MLISLVTAYSFSFAALHNLIQTDKYIHAFIHANPGSSRSRWVVLERKANGVDGKGREGKDRKLRKGKERKGMRGETR